MGETRFGITHKGGSKTIEQEEVAALLSFGITGPFAVAI
jgi:hypothetical protein